MADNITQVGVLNFLFLYFYLSIETQQNQK